VGRALSGGRPKVWPHRVLKGSIIFLTVCVLAAGSGYAYLRHQLARINRLNIPGLDESDGMMNVLLVGSDSRENVTGDLAETTGKDEVSGQRSDTIMVLHVDAKHSKAAIFSIPRDLYVPIAGTDYSDRVNTSFSVGGAAGLIATIETALGFPINHYVEVDFTGFRDIVDAVDGVKVYFPSPVRDDVSGLAIEDPGCITLNGDAGLAFVRSRNYETYESGEWQTDPTADLGRIQRQQDFIRRMLRKAVASGISNPLTLNRLVGIGVRDVTLDDQMSTGDIVKLARRFRSLDADTVDMLTFPTEPTDIGGAAVLLLKEAEAQPYIDRLNGIAPPDDAPSDSVRPSDIRVRILNGYGADGVATEASVDLSGAGFNVADRGDADSYNYSATVIRYAPGAEAKADVLNQYVDGGAVIEEDSSLRTVDVTLVLGADYTGIVSLPAAGTDTTAPPASAAQPAPDAAPKGDAPGASC
jgi:polyisoprenyl-teichoic acid--peptidoglycan teichoic acid transferase